MLKLPGLVRTVVDYPARISCPNNRPLIRIKETGKSQSLRFYFFSEMLHVRSGLPGLLGSNAIRTHHFVVLMLNDVAMPDELAWI
jgi:hypothetical protein